MNANRSSSRAIGTSLPFDTRLDECLMLLVAHNGQGKAYLLRC